MTHPASAPDAGWSVASTTERVLGRVISCLVGVLLLAAAGVALFAPLQPNITYGSERVRVAFAAMLLAAVGLWWLLRADGRSFALRRHRAASLLGRHPLPWSLAISVLGSAGCTLVALSVVYRVDWDANVVKSAAAALAGGHGLDPYYYSYFSRYSNNIPLLDADNICARLAAAWGLAPGTVFVLLNGASLAVTVQSGYAVVRVVRGPGAAVAAQGLTLALLGLSPWMAVPYTDILAMPVPVLATALVLTASRSRSRPRWVLTGLLVVLLVAVGYVLKTTPAVTLVAVGMVALLAALRGRSSARTTARRLVGVVVVLALGAGLMLATSSLVKQWALSASGLEVSRVDTSRTPPIVWWLAMGTTTRGGPRPRYGAYDGKIVAATYNMPPAEVKAYSTALLLNRLRRYGLSGYAAFVAKKYAWNWGDGMFWAYGEGGDGARPVLAHGPLTPWATTWNNARGTSYPLRADLTQALWLLLIALGGAGLVASAYRRDILLLALSVLGIALFTVIFQGRSRYLIVYVPVVIALSASVSLRRRVRPDVSRGAVSRGGRGRGDAPRAGHPGAPA